MSQISWRLDLEGQADLRGQPADEQIDVRGKVCPYPTVQAIKTLDQMADGQVLAVVADYPPARTTLPFLFWKRGYAWEIVNDEGEQFRARVRKQVVSSPPVPPGFR